MQAVESPSSRATCFIRLRNLAAGRSGKHPVSESPIAKARKADKARCVGAPLYSTGDWPLQSMQETQRHQESVITPTTLSLQRGPQTGRISDLLGRSAEGAAATTPRHSAIPEPIFSLFLYLAREGIHINDLFRRPGNISQMRGINASLAAGKPVDWSQYNIYTVANVAKKFLISLPGGLFGGHNERRLLATATVTAAPTPSSSVSPAEHSQQPSPGRLPTQLVHAAGLIPTGSPADIRLPRLIAKPLETGSRIDIFGLGDLTFVEQRQLSILIRVLERLPVASRDLAILVFGILHNMVVHATALVTKGCEVCGTIDEPHSAPLPPPIFTLAEGVAKSVAGTLFHTCPVAVELVDCAAQVLQTILLRFRHLGEHVTAFYAGILDGSITSTSITSLHTMISVFPLFLAPQSASDVSSKKARIPSKPLSLLSFARRLLCLAGSGSSTVSHGRSHTPTSKPLPTDTLARTSSRPSSSSSAASAGGKHSEPLIHGAEATVLPFSFPNILDKTTEAEVHPSEVQVHETIDQEAVSASSCEAQPISCEVPAIRRVSTIRARNRYRAVHRRQMEALLRRTAWFMGTDVTEEPTTTQEPSSNGVPRVLVTSDCGVCCCAAGGLSVPPVIAVTPISTVSLIDVGVELGQSEANLCAQYRLETSSASALIRGSFQTDLDTQRVLCISSTPRGSITSVRSAPTRQVSAAASPDLRSRRPPDTWPRVCSEHHFTGSGA